MIHKFVFDDAKFDECHGGTIAVDGDGSLLIAFFAGSNEGNPDTAIYLSRSVNGGLTWSHPVLTYKVAAKAHWNPVLFLDPSGKMRIFFKVGNNITTWVTYQHIIGSSDEVLPLVGLPTEITKDNYRDAFSRGPVRSKPLVLPNGDWVCPSSFESLMYSAYQLVPAFWDSFFDIAPSGDLSRLTRTKDVKLPEDYFYANCVRLLGNGIIQPTLWSTGGSGVSALFRSTIGYLCQSNSSDNGRTWSEASITSIPNNNSGVDVAKVGDVLALGYNPVCGNWGLRSPLSVSLSKDCGKNCGKTWTDPFDIIGGHGSFSYPSLAEHNGCLVGIYTWNRVGMVYFRLDLSKKTAPPLVEPSTMVARKERREHERQLSLL